MAKAGEGPEGSPKKKKKENKKMNYTIHFDPNADREPYSLCLGKGAGFNHVDFFKTYDKAQKAAEWAAESWKRRFPNSDVRIFYTEGWLGELKEIARL